MPKMTADNSPYGLMSLEAFTFSRNLAKELKEITGNHPVIVHNKIPNSLSLVNKISIHIGRS